MQRIAAPGLIAGAVGAGGNLLKASESLQKPAFRIHIALEKGAHESIHGGVLLQGVDGGGEAGRVIKLRGSCVPRDGQPITVRHRPNPPLQPHGPGRQLRCQQPASSTGMRTLCICHVPDAVAERLEKLAQKAGLTLSSFALQELTETARRADNAELLSSLPSQPIERSSILEALHASRDER